MADRLVVRGAREHNLKGVDLDLPRDSLIVFTGLSGSGKSSLAFDTIFAEGQRRYVESLSAYARQFLGQMDKPDVDFIEGLSPAVSIDQKSTNRNPRSTVGTITEVYDYLRLLYARAGMPHCPMCGKRDREADPAADRRPGAGDGGGRALPGARAGRPRPQGRVRRPVHYLQGQGFSRVLVDGTVHPLTEPPKLKKQEKHDIEVVVDRLTVKADREAAAHRLGRDGAAAGRWPRRARVRRPRRGRPPPRAALLRAHGLPQRPPARGRRPRAALVLLQLALRRLPGVHGLGIRKEVDPELVVPDASSAWPTARSRRGPSGTAPSTSRACSRPVRAASASAWTRRGASCRPGAEGRAARLDDQVHVRYRNRYGRERSYYADFEGVMPFLERRLDQPSPRAQRERYEGYMRDVPCPRAARARGSSRRSSPSRCSTRPGERSIAEVTALSVADCAEFLNGHGARRRASRSSPGACSRRSQARLGLPARRRAHYLSLARAAATLSGGEAQRIRLATQIGSGLVGVLYVLDEPSIGLHQRDNRRLIETLVAAARPGQHADRRRARRGHDPRVGLGRRHRPRRRRARRRDRAQRHRSRASSTPPSRSPAPTCPAGERSRCPTIRRPIDRKRQLTIVGAREHNLRGIDVDIPLGVPGRDHRGVRLGQVHAGQRHPRHGAGQQAQRRPPGARPAHPHHRARRSSTSSCASTSRRSAAPRGPTRPPTPACGTRSASCSPPPPRPRCAATSPAGSRSTSRAAAARRAPATARSRSR